MRETINLNEMNKLEKYLKDKGIKYERFDDEGHFNVNLNTLVGVRHQIKFFVGDDEQSIVCHPYTYGYERGLLEGLGSLFYWGEDGDNVVGFMTAEDVIEKIENPQRYSPYREMYELIDESVNTIHMNMRSTFTGIKSQLDCIVEEIQKEKLTLNDVRERLERLSEDLEV